MEDEEDVEARAAYWFARSRADDFAKDQPRFAAWLRDPRHREAYEQLAATDRGFGVMHDSDQLDAFRLRVPWWKRLALDRPRGWVPALAGVMLIAFLGFWVTRGHHPLGVTTDYASAVGEIRTIRLDDGSTVTLDTASAMTLDLSGRERRVRLMRGRARFDVVHDADRPFVVLAADAQITDKGTMFDVALLDRRTDVTLLRGIVEVRALAARANAQEKTPLVLKPGERATVTANQRPSVTPANGRAQAGWVSGMLEFNDAPLSDVLAEVNRYNRVQIVLADTALATLKVTGSYRADAPGDIARNLAALFGLRVETDVRGNWILRQASTASPHGQ